MMLGLLFDKDTINEDVKPQRCQTINEEVLRSPWTNYNVVYLDRNPWWHTKSYTWWCHTLNEWPQLMMALMKVGRLDDDVEYLIWWLEDYLETFLMMLPMNYCCTSIWWNCWIFGYYHDDKDLLHDDMDVLHDDTMILWLMNMIQWWNNGGIFSQWDLDHLKEDFFLFLMSLYLPWNSR